MGQGSRQSQQETKSGMILLSIHPILQFSAIVLAFYAAWLGIQRTRSLHFEVTAEFNRNLHVILGALALILMLCGIAAGKIIVARFLPEGMVLHTGLHGEAAMLSLPFLVFGLFSGFYLYLNPQKRKILPALHACNNLVVLLIAILQIITGLKVLLMVFKS